MTRYEGTNAECRDQTVAFLAHYLNFDVLIDYVYGFLCKELAYRAAAPVVY